LNINAWISRWIDLADMAKMNMDNHIDILEWIFPILPPQQE
jgi:hypothetical protein